MYLRIFTAVAALPCRRIREVSGGRKVFARRRKTSTSIKPRMTYRSAISQKLSVVLTRPVIWPAQCRSQLTLKCSLHSPATEIPRSSSQSIAFS